MQTKLLAEYDPVTCVDSNEECQGVPDLSFKIRCIDRVVVD